MRRFLLAAGAVAVLAAGVAAPVWAASDNRYTSFWALGDSLTDPGNLSAATGGAVPGAPYVGGRFSNGPVWAEHVAADFAAKGLAAGNFAFGGATAGAEGSPFHLGTQIGAFAGASSGRLGDRPVASLWFGANDVINAIPLGTARETGSQAARSVVAGAHALGKLGVKDVVVFNLPRLDAVPRYAFGTPDAQAQAAAGSKAFNRDLARRAEGLKKQGMTVTIIEMDQLFSELLDDPTRFGVANATIPCHIPGVRTCDLATEAPFLAFFDPIHPNATIHKAIAEVVRGEVAPVPLPLPGLLLLAGVAGIALVRRAGQGSRIA